MKLTRKVMKNNLFILTKHSLPYIGYSFLAFVIFTILDLDFFAFVALVFMLFSAYIFRNPEREYPSFQENSITSPADGNVIAIKKLTDSEYSYRIDIDSSYFDVSFLRMPLNAKVEKLAFYRGTRVSRNSKLFNDLNEYTELLLSDKQANKIRIVHRLKQSFAPLFIDVLHNDELMKCSRYGVMLNGISSIYVPKSFRVNVVLGDRVKASESLLGYFS
jgi:phosphatidylserine decarboxylase